MQPFVKLNAIAAPIEATNVDTDQIIPARFLRKPRREGYGNFLFRDMRYDDAGREKAGFVLNRTPFDAARILVAGANFGCGSSREGAVYALYDFGIRAVIAPSFGDIFHTNCVKNGVVPVALASEEVATVMAQLRAGPPCEVEVDMDQRKVTAPGGQAFNFVIDPFARECLMLGLDDVALTLRYQKEIELFETAHHRRHPGWYPTRPMG
jgi:3-isopropylmalate/(R)-2-methylmalate dehydratase small subunit